MTETCLKGALAMARAQLPLEQHYLCRALQAAHGEDPQLLALAVQEDLFSTHLFVPWTRPCKLPVTNLL